MSNLVPTGGGTFLPSRAERSAGRAIERVRASQAVLTARETAKLEVIGDVTEAALMTSSHIAAVEALLVERTPHAAGRLQAIADAGTLGLAEVVMKTARTVR
jgi:hypothetical protein